MKKLILMTVALFAFTSVANATLLFSEDFSDLTGWNAVYGQITADPLVEANSVLNFSHTNSHGDTFSPLINNTASTYWITFDYLSTDTSSANGGGFFGIDQDGYKTGTLGGPNGSHTWFLGTPVYGVDYLPQSDGEWQHVAYSFSAPTWSQFSLMFEDFRGVGSDAYFDNINLYDSAPVPEPGTIILLGSGLAGLAFLRRRKS